MEDGENKESYGKKLVRGGGITFIGLIIISASQFLLRIFLAQGLSKAEFGLLFAVFSFLSLLNTFSMVGLGTAVTKFISKFRAKGKPDQAKSSMITSLSIITGISLLITAIVIASSGFLASSYFNSQKAVPILLILSLWFFFGSLFNIFTSVFSGVKDFFGRILGRVTRQLIPAVGIILLGIFFNIGLINAAMFYLLGTIVGTILLYGLLRDRHSDITAEASGKFSKPLAKKMLAFGLPLIFTGLANTLIGRTDRLMLTGLRSLGDVGIYEVARMSKPLVGRVASIVTLPLLPIVSELWAKKEMGRLRDMLKFLTKFSFIGVIPAALILLAFPEAFINIFFGSKYLGAVNPLRILTISSVFLALTGIYSKALVGTGETMLVLKSTGTGAVFNIFANLLLVPPYGATGAAIATGLSFGIVFILKFYYSRERIKFSFPLSAAIKTGAGSILTLLLLFGLKTILPLPIWPLILSAATLSALFYLVWLFRTRTIVKDDLDVLEATTPIPKRIFSLLRKITVE